ncbi:MAG TPA: NEAT domain-containing protein [Pseudogracilibacillus sp.]|nr:NEAT domain-containing protein [Pseudogracilibacillus sp.]
MENKTIPIDEGKFVVQVQALKQNKDEASAMAPYISKNSIITNEQGKLFLSLMFTEQDIITGFQIKNKQGEFIPCVNAHTDTETNARYENFSLDALKDFHDARVQYKVNQDGNIFEGDETLRLFFDRDSVLNVNKIKF